MTEGKRTEDMRVKRSAMRWWIPVTVKPGTVFSIGRKFFLGITIIEFVAYIFLMNRVIRALYKYDQVKRVHVLTDAIAMSYQEMIVSSKFYQFLFVTAMVCMAALPLLFFFQHFLREKSIYTMLRIREKRIKKKFYIENVAVAIGGLILLFVLQIVLYCIGYLVYRHRVPVLNQPVQNLDWVKKPILPVLIVSMSILLPAMNMLFALAIQSRRRGIVAVLVLVLDTAVLYNLFYGQYVQYRLMVLIAAVLTVLVGLYYINQVQIV